MPLVSVRDKDWNAGTNCPCLDKVRLLYDRDLPTARIVVRTKEDLSPPLVGLLLQLLRIELIADFTLEHDPLLSSFDEPNPYQMSVQARAALDRH
jgi:hypothetical protein